MPKSREIDELFVALEQFNAKESVSEYFDMVLEKLKIKKEPVSFQDSRIKRVIEHISESPGETISLDRLARLANLSMSRLQHLFKEITGVPISKYMMWERMKKGIAVSGIEHSLTKSAHGAGFADSAHLSREFKKMFGYSPSAALKDSRNVQVYFD
jgi:AraC-like DNA-binding protein